MSSLSEIFEGSARNKKTSEKKKRRNKTQSLFLESNAFLAPPPQKKTPKAPPPDPPKVAKVPEESHLDAEERTVFVGNLSLATKQLPKKLKRHFGVHGEVESVRLRSVPSVEGDNAPKRVIAQNRRFSEDRPCNAYVVFKSTEGARAALTMNMSTFHGNLIRVDSASQPRFMQKRKRLDSAPGNFTSKDSVIVKHMDKEISDEALLELFSDGVLVPLCKDMVRNWRIVRDHKTGDCKGYAFLAFKHPSAAKAALTLTGHTLGRHSIAIEPIRSKSTRSPNRRPSRIRSSTRVAGRGKKHGVKGTRGVQKRRSWGGMRTKGPFKLIGARVKK